MISINYKEISSELTFEGTREDENKRYIFYIHETGDDCTVEWGMDRPDCYLAAEHKIIDVFKKNR